jgi:hypothetical protein
MKTTPFTRWILTLVISVFMLGGCAPGPVGLDDNGLTAEPAAATEQHTAEPTEAAAEDEASEEPTAAPDVAPATDEAPTDSGEEEPMTSVPNGASGAAAPADLISSIVTDLAGRLGIDASQIAVVSATGVTWSDGSLGCPQPGQMYTQALVPGFQVILEAGGKQYDYHASERGGFKLCQGTGAGVPGVRPPGDDPTH